MAGYEVRVETRAEQSAVTAHATLRTTAIGDWLAASYTAIGSWLSARGIEPAGPPYARYRELGDGGFDVDAGFPVPEAVEPDGSLPVDVETATLPGGTAAVTTHVGRYDEVGAAYEALVAWVAGHAGRLAGDPWEEYLDGPEVDPDATRTVVVQPYRPRA